MEKTESTGKTLQIKMMVFAALFAALTAVGAQIAVPIGPVPIVLANIFVLMAGLLLGKKWASASIGLYLLIGAIGIPVFSNAGSGLTHLLGPKGGYLLGYVAAAFVIALICNIGTSALWKDIVAVFVGIAVVYLIGVPWLKIKLDMNWPKAFSAGMFPFIPGDLIKGSIAVALTRILRPQLNER